MTLSIVCGFVPTFSFPIAGVWADRYNRKVLIVIGFDDSHFYSYISYSLFKWILFALATLCMLAVRAIGAGIQTPAVGASFLSWFRKKKLNKSKRNKR